MRLIIQFGVIFVALFIGFVFGSSSKEKEMKQMYETILASIDKNSIWLNSRMVTQIDRVVDLITEEGDK